MHMRLYLMQHGLARDGETDTERTLTEEGRREVERVARFLARTAPSKSGRVLHSGKTRARQTAEILAAVDPNLTVEETTGLAPNDDPIIWAQKAAATDETLALVGHLPHLERLASLLLVGQARVPVVSFCNGGMVCLERSRAGVWTVKWAVVPWLIPEEPGTTP